MEKLHRLFMKRSPVGANVKLSELTGFHLRRSSRLFSSLSSSLDNKRHRGNFPGKSSPAPFQIKIYLFVENLNSPVCEICNHSLVKIVSLSSCGRSELEHTVHRMYCLVLGTSSIYCLVLYIILVLYFAWYSVLVSYIA